MQPFDNTHQLSEERRLAVLTDLQAFQRLFSDASLAVRRDLFNMQNTVNAGQPINPKDWTPVCAHLEEMRNVLFYLGDWVYKQMQAQKEFDTNATDTL